MKILGVDPGFANVGLCVYDTDTKKVVKFHYIKTTKNTNPQVTDRINRLDVISDVVLNIMGDNDVKEVAVEFLFRSPSVTGTATTSMCLGSVLGLAKFFLLPVKSDVASAMRKKVFGRSKIPDDLMYDLLSQQPSVKEALVDLPKSQQTHCLDAYLCVLWSLGETLLAPEIPNGKQQKSKSPGNTKKSKHAGVGSKKKKASP